MSLKYDNFRFHCTVVSEKRLNSVYAKVSVRPCRWTAFSLVIVIVEKYD